MRKAVWQVLGLFVVTTMLALLVSCGGGSSSKGEGNTVYLTGNIKSGSSMAASVNTLALDDKIPTFDYVIRSTPYPSNDNVTASNVTINEVNLSFIFDKPNHVKCGDVLKPEGLSIKISAEVTPGGTANIDNSIAITPELINSINQCDDVTTSDTLQYTVRAVFKGVERNSDLKITMNPVESTLFVVKQPVIVPPVGGE